MMSSSSEIPDLDRQSNLQVPLTGIRTKVHNIENANLELELEFKVLDFRKKKSRV